MNSSLRPAAVFPFFPLPLGPVSSTSLEIYFVCSWETTSTWLTPSHICGVVPTTQGRKRRGGLWNWAMKCHRMTFFDRVLFPHTGARERLCCLRLLKASWWESSAREGLLPEHEDLSSSPNAHTKNAWHGRVLLQLQSWEGRGQCP